jgi:hypothetical protein
MPRQSIPILGPSSVNSVIQVNPQKTVNMYLKAEGAGAKHPFTLRHTPGLFLKETATGGTGRSNGVMFDSRLFFIIGEKLCSIDTNGILSEVGTLLTSSGRVDIVAGRDYILLTDGTYGYAWDGVTFTANIQATDADFPDNPTHCEYLDGFFLVNESGTDNFYKSASENPLSWDALEFEVASAAPDNILAIRAYDRDFIAFGQWTIQRYFNSGDADFPFSPYPNTVQAGILAPYSVISTAFGTPFLGNTKDGYTAVFMLAGGQLTRLSDKDIDDRISELTSKSSAIGSVYTQKGHTFYCLTFPGDDLTLVCDLSQDNVWHDRSSLIDGEAGRWRVSGLGYLAGNKIYAVDYANANIYELSLTTYSENELTIQRRRVTQIIHNERNRFTIHSRETEMRAGVGLVSGQGSNPQMMMRISSDGGITYSGWRNKPFGKLGEYRRRAVYKRVGEFLQYNEEIMITDPVPVCMTAGYAEIEWGYT